MKFKLLEFGIHEVDKMVNIKFKIEVQGEIIEYDEMLKVTDKDDRALMESFEAFINSKVVR